MFQRPYITAVTAYTGAVASVVSAAPTVPVCPPDVANGSQRDPADCSRYYICLSGVPHRLNCPAGQYFSTYTNGCGAFSNMSPLDQSYCSALAQSEFAIKSPGPNLNQTIDYADIQITSL